MTEKQMDDVYYVCSLIEYMARKTKNHRQDIVRHFTKADMEQAGVNPLTLTNACEYEQLENLRRILKIDERLPESLKYDILKYTNNRFCRM